MFNTLTKLSFTIVVALCLFAHSSVQAGDGALGADAIGVHTGFSASDLNDREDDYEVVPVVVRFGYDIDAWVAESLGLEAGDWWFNLEPFYGQAVSPNNRIEFGCALMLRWAYPVSDTNLGVFLEGGAGPMYMTQETEEQGTQFNFIDYLGAGLTYAVDEGMDIELGVRYRHVSNAGIDDENSGIDGYTGLLGVTRKF
jgi:lipid A 3-O-deacylase